MFFLLSGSAWGQWIVKPYGWGGDAATAFGPRQRTLYIGGNYIWNLRRIGSRNISNGGNMYIARAEVQLGRNWDRACQATNLRLSGALGMYMGKYALAGPRLQSGIILGPRPGVIGLYVEPGIALCEYITLYSGYAWHPAPRQADGSGRNGFYWGFSLTLSRAPWFMLLDRIQGCS